MHGQRYARESLIGAEEEVKIIIQTRQCLIVTMEILYNGI